VLLVLAGLVAFVGLEYSNTAQKIHERITSEPPQLVPPPLKAARLSAIDKDAARAVAELFITTAVLRQRVGASWDVLAPSMQKGFTRASWSAGDIPVQPFVPASAVLGIKYRVDWSGKDKVYLKIAIVPKPDSNVNGQAFDMGLERSRAAGPHAWLVDYFVPNGLGFAGGSTRAASRAAAPELKGRIGAGWLIAPIAVIGGLILLVPLFLGGRGLYRSSRANRLYRESA